MLKEDYETKLTTLNEPFEIGFPNKHSRLRLSEIDIHRLKTDQIFPHRQIIRFNSNYLETIDSWEFIRGRAAALALPMWAVCLVAFIFAIYAAIDVFFKVEYFFSFLFFSLSIPFGWMIYTYYNICRYDLFGYTHYPIRFNRKTQKVYAFSPQRQKIIELNWQDLRFSTVKEGSNVELRASLVNDNNIVEDEITLSYLALDYKQELATQNLAFLKAYMEGEDLRRLDAAIPEFFDIYNRKETWRESFERIYMSFDDHEIIQGTRPSEKGTIGMSIGAAMWIPWVGLRHIVILLSKIPQWPAHIEKECEIEPNDPYDSTGKKRHLEPLVFTWSEKIIIFIGWLIGTSVLLGFWIALALFSLNTW